MNLIGKEVKYKNSEIGVISAQTATILTVDFDSGTRKLAYNKDIFTKFLEAVDPDIQVAILGEFEAQRNQTLKEYQEKDAQRAAKRPSPTTKKVAKTLDDMFGKDYHVSYLARSPILTYQEVEAQFGISITGFGKGINPTDSAVVLISSIGKADGNFVYHDRWTADGDYLYSGEGKTGDQQMTRGNLAIKNAERDMKPIFLFVKLSPQEYYYQGVFKLVSYTYENEKDENGRLRKEFKFRLRRC